MYFIILVKFKVKATKETIATNLKWIGVEEKEGIKYHGIYWTLGRFDAVAVCEAPNEKVMMKALLRRSEVLSTETLVALPAIEARKLVE